jgi:hypothetical protein
LTLEAIFESIFGCRKIALLFPVGEWNIGRCHFKKKEKENKRKVADKGNVKG